LFLGRRIQQEETPANIPFVILGTGLLWFGWFGFNAGSAFSAGTDAVLAFANTNLASATAMITWIFFDRYRDRKMSAVGACIGAVVGLVAITPAAGFVSLGDSLLIGFIASLISNLCIDVFHKSGRVDDTLDVFASHGVGGMVGMVLTGVFAAEIGLTSGETETFVKHLVALLGVAVGAFGLSYGLFAVVNALIPMRVTEHQEKRGLDDSQHGEKMS
jgi:Amt family ammonium transporter